MAKIINIEENCIEFSDGTVIHCDHKEEGCEYNYADFPQLDDLARNYNFDTSSLRFEAVEDSGFRFGDSPFKMFFVPCYSCQSGYYSSDIDVYLNGVLQCSFDGEVDYV